MSYVAKSLANGENVKYIAVKHWIVHVGPIFAVVVSLILPLALLITVPMLIMAWLNQRTTELAVTNRKVIGKWGIVSRRTFEQRLEKVDSIQVNQGILGRLFGYGTILI